MSYKITLCYVEVACLLFSELFTTLTYFHMNNFYPCFISKCTITYYIFFLGRSIIFPVIDLANLQIINISSEKFCFETNFYAYFNNPKWKIPMQFGIALFPRFFLVDYIIMFINQFLKNKPLWYWYFDLVSLFILV